MKRKHGNYNYKLNLQLKNQVVTDFNIKININETLELDMDSINVRRESNEIYKLSSEELVSNITTNVDFPNQAIIEYSDQENSVQDWILMLIMTSKDLRMEMKCKLVLVDLSIIFLQKILQLWPNMLYLSLMFLDLWEGDPLDKHRMH